MSSTTPDTTEKQGGLVGALQVLERIGNKLPHPFWLFLILGGIILAASAILGRIGVSAVSPADGETVAVVNLLTPEGLRQIVTEAVPNFTAFPPLGLIIVVMLGVAVAECSGLLAAAIRAVVAKVSPRWLTFVLALTGVTGSVASDAIYVVLIPLGAAAFKAVGRSPVLGAVVAFGSASAGYNASLLVTGTDAILAGLSTSAAQLVEEGYVVSPVANYFFSIASAIVLALIITAVTELLLTRTTRGLDDDSDDAEGLDDLNVAEDESKGLRRAGLTALVLLAAYFAALFVPGSPLRGEEGVLDSPLLTDIVVPIAIIFAGAGLAYGLTTRSITSAGDVPSMMGKGIVSLAPVLVLFFAAAQFVAYFKWSNIGPIIAIEGSSILQSWNLPPL
ncbi:hypothetical protein GCM10009584_18010 [Ornithinimicrobium humiphilum]|uniref:Aminobenzoyl-glutamate transport protein n=1 Tax=Ornithinimicrobium humiphilum TaxID=125288 RepID=A0A543KLE4_9MICO|nr:aminobenzoyl-glutamate transport protein [Ornithinimicrobium humiphilum]